MAGAVRVIVKQGLSAPTAVIAKEAGVANGSLFTYFETKTALFNQLYLELKSEMASAALEDLPRDAPLRDQLLHVWSGWMRWAAQGPDKRRALALLGVSDDISPATRNAGHRTMAELADLLQQARARGPMRDAPFELVVALLNAVADTTMDFVVNDPARADQHCVTGFEAMWRMLGG